MEFALESQQRPEAIDRFQAATNDVEQSGGDAARLPRIRTRQRRGRKAQEFDFGRGFHHLGGLGDEEFHDPVHAVRVAAHEVQGPTHQDAVTVAGQPTGDGLHALVRVDREHERDLWVAQLVQAAEGESEFRQPLLLHPLFGDFGDLQGLRQGQGAVRRPDGPHLRAFGAADRRAHVLPFLACRLPGAGSQHSFFGDPHQLPAHALEDGAPILVEAVEHGDPAAVIAQAGKPRHGPGRIRWRPDRLRGGDRHSADNSISDHGSARRVEPERVSLPRRHVRERAAAAG